MKKWNYIAIISIIISLICFVICIKNNTILGSIGWLYSIFWIMESYFRTDKIQEYAEMVKKLNNDNIKIFNDSMKYYKALTAMGEVSKENFILRMALGQRQNTIGKN